MAKKRSEWVEVFSGSELNGSDQSISDWVGIEVPDNKWDDYVELVSGVNPLQELFERTTHGFFEITEEEDDQGPGMSDTYWKVTTKDPEALKKELRELLNSELGLETPPKRRVGRRKAS